MSSVDDAKAIGELVSPLVEKFKDTKSNRVSIGKLIKELMEQENKHPLSEDSKRGILFEFRDNNFLDFKETQDLWLDLAESWGIEKHLPHLINKTKQPF